MLNLNCCQWLIHKLTRSTLSQEWTTTLQVLNHLRVCATHLRLVEIVGWIILVHLLHLCLHLLLLKSRRLVRCTCFNLLRKSLSISSSSRLHQLSLHLNLRLSVSITLNLLLTLVTTNHLATDKLTSRLVSHWLLLCPCSLRILQ